MSGILGGLTDLLFGKVEVPEADFDQLAKLLKLGIEENRYDQQGIFTGFQWDEGKNTITQSINPQLQGSMDAMYSRLDAGSPSYGRAGQFQELLDAYQSRAPRERRPPPERRERPPVYRPESSYPGGI